MKIARVLCPNDLSEDSAHAVAEERTDVIVIGVHGRYPVDMALFGSTTNQVVRRATCPVLTLRH